MVVSQEPLATRAGIAALEAGGNAADAAVATALALCVVHPRGGGLGGGGLALWVAHDPDEPPLALDFREASPATLSEERLAALRAEDGGAHDGRARPSAALAVGVPGAPAGLWLFHRRLGRLPFATVVAPAIDLARRGFVVDESLARELLDPDVRARLCAAGMARSVLYPDGAALQFGSPLRQEVLGRTLEGLAARGPEGFYQGAVAEALVAAVASQGGLLAHEDLRAYQPRWREPLRGWFRGLEVVTAPPPSAGGLELLQVLAILDGFPLDEEMENALRVRLEREESGRSDVAEPGLDGRAVHWWIEALRRGFADGVAHVGDPDFVEVPVARLLSPSWIAERRVSIGELADPHVQALPAEGAAPALGGETTHVSVLDREGNAVSLTMSLHSAFGSGLMVRGGGFLLNDAMRGFAPSGPDAIAPGKRPATSMAPTVVREGGQTVRLVLGSPGGPRLVGALVQTLLRLEVYGEDLAEAIRAPRLHQGWRPPWTAFEEGWDPLLLQDLRNRGHDVRVELAEPPGGGSFGAVQAIRTEVGGTPVGVSDPRATGLALLERPEE